MTELEEYFHQCQIAFDYLSDKEKLNLMFTAMSMIMTTEDFRLFLETFRNSQ